MLGLPPSRPAATRSQLLPSNGLRRCSRKMTEALRAAGLHSHGRGG